MGFPLEVGAIFHAPFWYEAIPILRQKKDWSGRFRKMAIFADAHYCIYTDNLDGWLGPKKSEKMPT